MNQGQTHSRPTKARASSLGTAARPDRLLLGILVFTSSAFALFTVLFTVLVTVLVTVLFTVFISAPVFAQQNLWRVTRSGSFVTAENDLLKLVFADKTQKNDGGWFQGSRQWNQGAPQEGIIELVYKKTSPRNLIPRSRYGGAYESLCVHEAEFSATSTEDWQTPDVWSSLDAQNVVLTISESSGRLTASYSFKLGPWDMIKDYIVYPWGQITVSTQITQREDRRVGYLGFRCGIAASKYQVSNQAGPAFEAGSSLVDESRTSGAHYISFTDGNDGNGNLNQTIDTYTRPFHEIWDQGSWGENQAASIRGKPQQQYVGFMANAKTADPDFVALHTEGNSQNAPYVKISKQLGSQAKGYAETAIWNYFPGDTTPQHRLDTQFTWFAVALSNVFDTSTIMNWPRTLGTWREAVNLFFRTNLEDQDFTSLYRVFARDTRAHAIQLLSAGSQRLDDRDYLRHVAAASTNQAELKFRFVRSSTLTRNLETRIPIYLDGFAAKNVALKVITPNALAPNVDYYPGTDGTLLSLKGEESASPVTYEITVSR